MRWPQGEPRPETGCEQACPPSPGHGVVWRGHSGVGCLLCARLRARNRGAGNCTPRHFSPGAAGRSRPRQWGEGSTEVTGSTQASGGGATGGIWKGASRWGRAIYGGGCTLGLAGGFSHRSVFSRSLGGQTSQTKVYGAVSPLGNLGNRPSSHLWLPEGASNPWLVDAPGQPLPPSSQACPRVCVPRAARPRSSTTSSPSRLQRPISKYSCRRRLRVNEDSGGGGTTPPITDCEQRV